MMLRRGIILLIILIMTAPVAAQDSVDLTCGQVTVEGAESGAMYTATCPAGCGEGTIWGTDVYTDDSDICTAAAHAGVIDLAEGGTFELLYIDGQDEYPAGEQNGIESSSWGSWDLSFTFGSSGIALTCDQTTVEGAEAGNMYTVTCPAKCGEGSLWGTDVYTDDSNICTAAAHAGVIDLATGGTFDLYYVDGQDEYLASEQNGIESSSWGSWGLGFTFDLEESADSSSMALTCDQTTIEGAEIGDSYAVSCPSGCSAGSLWGTDVYTDDSNICTAAAHAGVIDLAEGGTFDLVYVEGQDEYPASAQNGIESSSWGSWDIGFTFGEEAIPMEWGESGQVLEGDTGDYGLVECPTGGEEGFIWGTDVYSDDSDVCTAAVHAGIITFADGGKFYVSIVDGQESYEASIRNDVESYEWEAWERSFVVAPELLEVDWGTTAQELPGPMGSNYVVECPAGGSASSIWGTFIYSDDSDICTAAVHSGVITLEDGGEVLVTIIDGQDSYEGSTQNGVDSLDWPAWERSFIVE